MKLARLSQGRRNHYGRYGRGTFIRPKISVRPDLSLKARHSRAILLHERRKLIENGTNRSLIKIRGNSLFVGDIIQGSIVDDEFMPAVDDNDAIVSADDAPVSVDESSFLGVA